MTTALVATLAAGAALAGKKETFQDWADGEKAYKKVWFGPGPTHYSGNSIERAEYDGYEGIIDGLARKTLEELDKRCGRGK